MSGSLIYVDFRLFPNNHQLPIRFLHGGLEFSALNQTSYSVVKDIKSDRGLNFDESGISITFPKIVDSFYIYGGSFADPIKINAKDSNANLIKSMNLLPNNKLVRHLFTAPNISVIELVGGNNEAFLLELTISFC